MGFVDGLEHQLFRLFLPSRCSPEHLRPLHLVASALPSSQLPAPSVLERRCSGLGGSGSGNCKKDGVGGGEDGKGAGEGSALSTAPLSVP